tara:strand:- start:2530 stop:3531 length:1002 start_codon:yes stop_codon:yes gene_type:complete
MLISDLGEFELIEILAKVLDDGHTSWGAAQMPHLNLSVSNGDDAAAWIPDTKYEVFTMDSSVENVHFKTDYSRWYDIGWKALASNISDIASMGGQPLYGLVTIGLPPTIKVDDLREMYQGFSDISHHYEMMVIGGDIVRSENVFISISLIGGTSNIPITRSAAKPGDCIFLSGTVGSSKAGLLLLQQQLAPYNADQEFLIQKHQKPYPHIRQGKSLGTIGNVSAMDVSDGLFSDLGKLCASSNCGAIIQSTSIPIDPQLKSCFPDEAINIALSGGEDYVLLGTVHPDQIDKLQQEIEISVIGEIVGQENGITVLDTSGSPYKNKDFLGWDHFI